MSNPSVRLACFALLSTGALAAAVAGCSSSNAKNDTTPSGSPTPDGGTPSGGNTSDAGMTSTNSDGGSGPAGDGGGTVMNEDGGGGSTTGAITSCTTGTLFAGDPLYSAAMPSERPTDGTGILTDPPFQWGNLTFAGNILYTRDTGEVWYTDTSAASPVEKRLFGLNNATSDEVDITFGTCAMARAGAIQGIEVLPDGSLVAADAFGNDILHIKDPQGATCAVESWAGTNTNTSFNGTAYPNLGDVDGVVGTSKIGYPTAITSDGAGTVYFYDGQAMKFKKIANDTVHTTTTIGPMPDSLDICYGMVHIGTTVYFLGYDGNVTNVYKLVGTTFTKVAGGNGDAWDGLSGETPQLGGITTDGTNLIVAGMGYVWLVNVTSGAITRIAGSGEITDIPANAKSPTPAMDLVLKPYEPASAASVGSPDYLGFKAGAVYYRGHGDSTAAYVEKIQCQ